MENTLFTSVFATLISVCLGCSNPTITSKSFTTQDATIVANIAYISEFTVNCGSGSLSSLYAEVNGNVVPVSNVGPNAFQVSWVEEPKTARTGDRPIRLFDEEGYAALRKALRSGEDTSSISSLFDVVVNHPGAYSGPWLKSEFIAAAVSLVVAYFAIANRSKVLS